jgi:site-specific DNA-methyltransferase (adenine-specific)
MRADLHFGDNLEWLTRLPAGIVDLCYIDPPFNSKADYNVIVGGAQVKAFDDTWSWNIEDMRVYKELLKNNGPVGKWAEGMMLAIGPCGMFSYLLYMATRLAEIKRVLKDTGSIYVHCDKYANHHLRFLLDAVFDPNNFRNEVIWYWETGQGSKNYFTQKHANIYFYSKSDEFRFEAQLIPYTAKELARYNCVDKETGQRFLWNSNKTAGKYKTFLTKTGKMLSDVWRIEYLTSGPELVGYPTQKPLALLERIILASSNPGDVVMDCFMGSGTTAVAALKNGRKFMGCDITFHAVDIAMDRLKVLEPAPEVVLTGHPETLDDARELAEHDRFQFQSWALDRVECNPTTDRTSKKGKDSGIDGRQVVTLEDGTLYTTIVSVKSGKPRATDLRDLIGTVSREKAQRGVLLALEDPTPDMIRDAATMGVGERGETMCLILTAQDLLEGKKIPEVK